MTRPKNIDKEITPLGQELIEAAKAMLAYRNGEEWTKDFPKYHYNIPSEVDVKSIRSQLHLTQQEFANIIGASVHSVRHWENGRRKPDGTARTLLYILQKNPQAIFDVLSLQQ